MYVKVYWMWAWERVRNNVNWNDTNILIFVGVSAFPFNIGSAISITIELFHWTIVNTSTGWHSLNKAKNEKNPFEMWIHTVHWVEHGGSRLSKYKTQSLSLWIETTAPKYRASEVPTELYFPNKCIRSNFEYLVILLFLIRILSFPKRGPFSCF